LKCDPERAIALREMYNAVRAGYHMSKKHWNTIEIDGSIDDQLIFEWTKNSYDLVVGGLTKKQRQESGL
jgi:predicted DNA-binding protein (MmcQ/YjbR family)